MPATTRTATVSCASAGSPSQRRRKSSRPSCRRKAARRKACSISCRGSPRSPAARRIRTRGLSLRAGRSDCWNAPETSESRATGKPVARLRFFGLISFAIFRRSGFRIGGGRVSASAARRAFRPGSRKQLPTSDKLGLSSAGLAPAFLFVPVRGRSPEKVCGLNTKIARQPVDNVDAGSVDASLQGADIGTVNPGTMRQFLLRQALGPTEFPQIDCQYLSYLHERESTALKSISPRSILDKMSQHGPNTAAAKPVQRARTAAVTNPVCGL